MQIINVRLIDGVPVPDEVVDHAGLQWSGSKQCDQCNEITETVRTQTLDQITHATRFELKDSRCLRTAQQVESLLVAH